MSRLNSMSHPLLMFFLILVASTSLTSARLLPQNRILDRKAADRARRQELVGKPSWTSPDFCYETGQIRDMASLMLHPPPSKTLDYASLCSEVLRPTNTVSFTSTIAGDAVVTVTSTATVSSSTTTSDYSRSTTTALCAIPSPSQRCSIPALGYSNNILYYRTHITGIECHELCLRDKECKSFQVVPQDNEELTYLRCNIYKTNIDGHVSENGEGDAMFWDRGCEGLLSPGCAGKIRTLNRKRDRKESGCCRLQRVRPDEAIDGVEDGQDNVPQLDDEDEALSVAGEGIRVERDESPDGAVVEVLPIDVDESIRVERDVESDVAEDALPVDTAEDIRVERTENPDSITDDNQLIDVDESIRIEKRTQNTYKLPLTSLETSEEAEALRNGYKLPLPSEDDGYRPALLSEDVRPMKRTFPTRTSRRSRNGYKIPTPETDGEEGKYVQAGIGAKAGPGKRNSPSFPKRTASPRLPSWYKIPIPETDEAYRLPELAPEPDNEVVRPEKFRRDHEPGFKRTLLPRMPAWYRIPTTEGDETHKLPIPESDDTYRLSEQDSEVVRPEKRDEEPADPLITPAPELPIPEEDTESIEAGKGIRVEKRDAWTTPDYLSTFFPLFITLACSCLIESAAPAVTSSVTDVVRSWEYTTTTSTKSEVYRFTEHPSWSTVYRTVG